MARRATTERQGSRLYRRQTTVVYVDCMLQADAAKWDCQIVKMEGMSSAYIQTVSIQPQHRQLLTHVVISSIHKRTIQNTHHLTHFVSSPCTPAPSDALGPSITPAPSDALGPSTTPESQTCWLPFSAVPCCQI